jgi:1-acyl-sn-glycerol-3-phosphate acyltransferase
VKRPHPPERFWLARVVRVAGRVLPLLFRTQVIGRANVPATGGVILAGNHVSYADPLLLWVVSPRPAHFMAKVELWDHTVLAWGLDTFWGFPVRRDVVDREALRQAGTLLKTGEVVGIFPEGTRTSGDGLGEAHNGAAFLAIHNHVPIVPVGISGTGDILPDGARFPRLPKVVISFGEPISPDAFGEHGHKERVGEMTKAVMAGIAREVEAARKGGRAQ